MSRVSPRVNIQAILVKMFIFLKWCINVNLDVLQWRGFTGSFKNVKVIFKELLFKLRRWNTGPRGFKDEKNENQYFLLTGVIWEFYAGESDGEILWRYCFCIYSFVLVLWTLLVKIYPSCLSPKFERTSAWWWQESTGSVNVDFLRLPGGASSCQFWQWRLCCGSTLLHGL